MKMMRAPLVATVATLWALLPQAGFGCDRCGCHDNSNKVCRLVCETKKVPKTTYSCDCVDFCVPGKSEKCGCKCVEGKCGHTRQVPDWVPTCAKVHAKVKLYKHVTQKEVKSYKWVVEDCCSQCAGQAAAETEANIKQAQTEGFDPGSPEYYYDDAEQTLATDEPAIRKTSFIGGFFGKKTASETR